MKKIYIIFPLFCILLIFTGCAKGKNPEEIANKEQHEKLRAIDDIIKDSFYYKDHETNLCFRRFHWRNLHSSTEAHVPCTEEVIKKLVNP